MTQPTVGELGQESIELTGPNQDDLVLWSVTSIIGILEKRGLMYWAAGRTADAAIDNPQTWQAMISERGRREAWKWLRDAMNRPPRDMLSDTKLGQILHSCCEDYALSGKRPDDADIADRVWRAGGDFVDVDREVSVLNAMLDNFDAWLQKFTPSYQATEVCVYNPTYGYAGQADCFLTIDGVRFLGDYKSTREPFDGQGKPKTPYPTENGLQLAAYRNAEMAAVWRPRRYEKQSRRYYALSPTERELAVPVPEVDTGLIIHITTEQCVAYPIKCDKTVHRYFLHCIEMARWVNEESKTVLGEPLR
jgi:hypothetical protein